MTGCNKVYDIQYQIDRLNCLVNLAADAIGQTHPAVPISLMYIKTRDIYDPFTADVWVPFVVTAILTWVKRVLGRVNLPRPFTENLIQTATTIGTIIKWGVDNIPPLEEAGLGEEELHREAGMFDLNGWPYL